MTAYPRISIVVVNLNLGDFLKDALESIFQQDYPNLELIVVDGGSIDKSLEIIRQVESRISWWISEPDGGQYQALQKGLQRATGDIMAWLNSDDMYFPGAFREVAGIFRRHSKAEWIMGFPTEYSHEGIAFRRITLPWARWSKYRYYTYDFQFIQQESVFWKRSLWEKAGGMVNANMKLAGDLELWTRFFRHAHLFTTTSILAGFRHRKTNQRSRDLLPQYLSEAEGVIRNELKRFGPVRRTGLFLMRLIGIPLGVFFFYDIRFLRKIYSAIFAIPPVLERDEDKDQTIFG